MDIRFVEEEYFLLRLLKGSYKKGLNIYESLKANNILNIITEYYDGDKLYLVMNNISNRRFNIILERFCEEDKKKFEIFIILKKLKNILMMYSILSWMIVIFLLLELRIFQWNLPN